MHPGMHLIDDDLVRRLIAGQFPQWAGLAVERWQSGGTVNAMYRLGGDMVVRLPPVQGGARDVPLEREWLPRLAPRLPARIPEVLGAGEPAQGYPWPWSVYRWLAGEHPEPGVLSEPVLLAGDLAAFVAAMRSITPARRAEGTPRRPARLARRGYPGRDQGTARDSAGGRRLRCRSPGMGGDAASPSLGWAAGVAACRSAAGKLAD